MSDCPVKANIHHVGFFVSDIDRAIQWWDEMFGFKCIYCEETTMPNGDKQVIGWLKAGNGYIELFEKKGHEQEEDQDRYLGTKHLCLYTKDEDFDKLVEHLKAKNVEFIIDYTWKYPLTKKPSGNRICFIKDPDGTKIEIQESYTPEVYLGVDV